MPKLLLPLVAVLAVGGSAAGGAAYLLTRDEAVEEVPPPAVQASPEPSPAATEAPKATPPSEPTPPDDWKTYTDETYGYSFDYPPSWYLERPPTSGGAAILYSYDPAKAKGIGEIPKDKLKVFFWVAEGVDQPLEEWLAEGKTSPGQISPPTVLSQDASMLGSKEGLVEVVEHDGEKITSYYIPIGDGRVFVVNAGPSDSEVWAEFELVLDTIRFSP